MLVVNADDWGWTPTVTDRTSECSRQGRVGSVSAMVFMADSGRAAELARGAGLDVGLHLNLTEEFSVPNAGRQLQSHLQGVSSVLKGRKLNQALYNPRLRSSVEYLFKAQWEEFCRLYDRPPTRLDGHHHMHLCMNVLLSDPIPRGIKVRRSFTFARGEKGLLNRLYRRMVDRRLAARFRCDDRFYAVVPMDVARLRRIAALAGELSVELMVHPGVDAEYRFLMSDEWRDVLAQAGAAVSAQAAR